MSVLSADYGYRLSYSYFAAPDDFTGVTNTFLSLDQSTRRVSVNISIADDSIVEAIEIFQASLTLVDPFIPTIITVTPSLANISIEDDDSKLTIQSIMPSYISTAIVL